MMRRFTHTIGHSIGCGAMLVGSGSTLLILWHALFNNLGVYFDLTEILEMVAASLIGGVLGMIVGCVLGLVMGFLIYVANDYRHIVQLLGFGGLALALVFGAAFAGSFYYRDFSQSVQQIVRLLYVVGFCIIGFYVGIFWGDWFERQMDRL